MLLIAAYVLAALVPGPGLWLRDLQYSDAEGAARFSLAMVAVLLASAAVMSDPLRLCELPGRPRALLVVIAGCWLAPLAIVWCTAVAVSACLPLAQASPVVLGLTLAAAMPVANSAVAWTHQSKGAINWALGLVILSIAASPLLTPLSLDWLGPRLSADQAAATEGMVLDSIGLIFVGWVLAPTAGGLCVGRLLGARGREAVGPWLALASAAALLLLNYANAAAALPRVVSEPQPLAIAVALVAALALPVGGAAAGWRLAPMVGVARRVRSAWAYSLGMRNTGLALALADRVLDSAPLAVLAILLVTLTQHVVAAAVHSIDGRTSARPATDAAPER